MSEIKRALFIFRRDLRLNDNTALLKALELSREVLCCFIFDPRQIAPEKNAYFSPSSVEFMLNSLSEVDAELRARSSRLFYFYGMPEEVLSLVHCAWPFQHIFVNRDFTPFSISRDQKIAEWAETQALGFSSCDDLLLNAPQAALKADRSPYTVFTPFFKRCAQLAVPKPRALKAGTFVKPDLRFDAEEDPQLFRPQHNPETALRGGREEALALLERALTLRDYAAQRDLPAQAGTTLLSAHNKFGTLSIREVYHALSGRLGQGHALIRQLYWRDFFSHIALHFPRVFGASFHPVYDRVEWDQNQDKFQAWCEGRTGFPIVDAGMRQLNRSGYMHNRVRMIAASFLVKDLHLDWRWGERYFARKLIDYDPAVNNGSWQWSASTGCDAQPYFRIFNPWLQQAKFDPQAVYIKRWVSELEALSAKEIHALGEDPSPCPGSYRQAMLDHAQEKQVAEEMFESARQSSRG